MPVLRYYSSVAQQTTLSGSISAAAGSITVGSVTGFPVSYPYTLALDYGAAAEELVDVTMAAGTVLTVTRGVDGTSAQSHSLGAVVRHVASGRDFADYQTHQAATSGVHGATGAVVGTTDVQTLTNKTLTAPAVSGGTFTGTPVFSGTASFTGTPTFSATTAMTVTGEISHSNLYRGTRALSTDSQLESRVSGDADARWYVQADGTMHWGSGAALTDLSFQRVLAGAGQLNGILAVSSSDTGAATEHLLVNTGAGVAATSKLLSLQNNGTAALEVTADGQVTTATQATTSVGLTVNAITGQTADLVDLKVAGATKLAVDAGGQITTYAANTFGTYVPAVTGWGTTTFSTRTGWYMKIGKMVFVSIKLVTSAAGSGTADCQVDLPSIPDGTTDNILLMRYAETAVGYAISFAGAVSATMDRLRVQDGSTAGQVKNLIGSFVTSGVNINIEGWYREA